MDEEEDGQHEEWNLRTKVGMKKEEKVLKELQKELVLSPNEEDLELDYEQDRVDVEKRMKKLDVDAQDTI